MFGGDRAALVEAEIDIVAAAVAASEVMSVIGGIRLLLPHKRLLIEKVKMWRALQVPKLDVE